MCLIQIQSRFWRTIFVFCCSCEAIWPPRRTQSSRLGKGWFAWFRFFFNIRIRNWQFSVGRIICEESRIETSPRLKISNDAGEFNELLFTVCSTICLVTSRKISLISDLGFSFLPFLSILFQLCLWNVPEWYSFEVPKQKSIHEETIICAKSHLLRVFMVHCVTHDT